MKKVFTLIAAGVALQFSAQNVGIGTAAPENPLHIDAAGNNSSTLNTKNQDDVVVAAGGNFGAGNSSPLTRLDARGDGNSNAIGIGWSAQTAAEAGAGAVRYNAASNFIEYSDGTAWIGLGKGAPSDYVVAENPAATEVANGTTPVITSWTKTEDSNSSFDPATGLFTAKFEGIYIVSAKIGFSPGTVVDNASMEVILETSNTAYVPEFKCLISYPGNLSGNAVSISSGSCSGIFKLNVGDTIFTKVRNGLGAARTIDPSLSRFTVIAL